MKFRYDYGDVVINSHASTVALGSSADGLWIPTALVKATPVFWYFTHGHGAELVQSKKGESVLVRHTSGTSQKQIAYLLYCHQCTVSRTIPTYRQSRFHLGRPLRGRPWPTTARNNTYLRVMVSRWCHLTTSTILKEWQPILTLWSPFTKNVTQYTRRN